MRLEWTRLATNDLDQILTYIAERNPSAAARIAERIDATVESVTRLPKAGRFDQPTGTFQRVVPRLPFLLIYTLNEADDVIQIIALFHTARDPKTKRRP